MPAAAAGRAAAGGMIIVIRRPKNENGRADPRQNCHSGSCFSAHNGVETSKNNFTTTVLIMHVYRSESAWKFQTFR